MEMIPTMPSAPPVPGQIPGKLPATEGGEFFRTLLNRQQAAVLGKKMAEEGDAALLTAWLLPGLPAETAEGVAVAAAEEGLADASISSLASGNHNVSPGEPGVGTRQQPGMVPSLLAGFTPEDVGLAAANQQILLAGLGEKGQTPGPTSGLFEPGIAPAGLTTVTVFGSSAPGLPLPLPPAEKPATTSRDAVVATRGRGILESRLAAILHPLQAVAGNGRSDENNPLLSAPARSAAPGDLRLDGIVPAPTAALTPATAVIAPVTPESAAAMTAIDPGALALLREPKGGEALPTAEPDILATADLTAPRPLAPVTKSLTAEGTARTQTFASHVSESQLLDQVIGRIAVTGKQDMSRMSIRLQPEELGRLDIDLTVENGRIKALVVAQNQQVQEVLERHLPRLREALEQQGLKLDQIQVSVDAHAGEGRGFSQQHREAENYARQWSRGAPPELIGEGEELPLPMISAMGQISLRI